LTAVFMSLDDSKGEAFGQLIIGFYLRLSSECFAPTLLKRNLNQNVVYLPENNCKNKTLLGWASCPPWCTSSR
ncbi:MAG: hypothetical protein ACKO2Z_37575, partial [Sphaerospermopsis kisseleviana]